MEYSWGTGVTFGLVIAAGAHWLLVDNLITSATVAGLYTVGIALLVTHMRRLREASGSRSGGDWWALGFCSVLGTVLLVVQYVYRPEDVGNPIAPSESITTLPPGYSLLLWVLLFGVAIVSVNFGIGMTLADGEP